MQKIANFNVNAGRTSDDCDNLVSVEKIILMTWEEPDGFSQHNTSPIRRKYEAHAFADHFTAQVNFVCTMHHEICAKNFYVGK